MTRRAFPAFLTLAVGLALACARDPVRELERDPQTLAVVGRYTLTISDLRKTFAYGQVGAEAGDAVRSRLWDALVDEVLVLNDLAAPPAPKIPVPMGVYSDPGYRADAVRHALEERVFSRATVGDAEVERFYAENPERFQRGKGLLVRQMYLTGRSQADEARQLLAGGHSFGDVARLYSGSPDSGGAQYFELEEIPEFLRPTLDALPAGRPSPPLEVAPGSFQILLVERRADRYTLPLEDVAPLIRLHLTDEAQGALTGRYFAALRERFPVVVFTPKLPFRYEKESP